MAGTAEEAKGKAQEVAGQAQEKARIGVRDQVDQRSTQAGEKISTQADDLRSVSRQLREQGKEGPAKVADQIAERAEKAGTWLQQADGDQILHDVEDLARKNPWAVMAGGIALGFAASRFLKASSTQRYETRSSQYSPYAYGTGTTGQLPVTAGDRRFSRDIGQTAAPTGTGVVPPPTGVPPTTDPRLG